MFTAELDPSSYANFQRTLQRLADSTDRPVEQVLRQQGRLLAKDLAFHIHPRGLAAGTARDYASAVQSFILSLYQPAMWLNAQIAKTHGEPAGDHVHRLILDGRYSEARKLAEGTLRPAIPAPFIAVGPFDGGALHKEWRWKRRRRYPILVVPDRDYPAVKRYAKEKAQLVGFAKAALINAGRQLDGKSPGIPAWITRHTAAPGRGLLTRLRQGFSGLLESRVRYAREALPLADEIRAFDVRQQTAEKQLQRIIDANIRKAMRGS